MKRFKSRSATVAQGDSRSTQPTPGWPCFLLAILVLWCFSSTLSFANRAAANSHIYNQGSLYYEHPAIGAERIYSNTVAIQVLAVTTFNLTPQHNITAQPQQQVVLPHQLHNSGNTPAEFNISWGNSGGDFALANPRVYIDENSNGLLDAGDTLLSQGAAISIDADSIADLLLVGMVPAGITAGQNALERICVDFEQQQKCVTDQITVPSQIAIILDKQVQQQTAKIGDQLDYRIEVSVEEPVSPIQIKVDNTNQSAIVLEDELPQGTQLSEVQHYSYATTAYRLAGDAENVYHTAYDNLADVIAVAWLYPQLSEDQIYLMEFSLTITGNAENVVYNTAKLYHASEPQGLKSNQTQTQLRQNDAQIGFYDADYVNTTSAISAGQALNFQLDSADCNTNAQSAESYTATIQSTETGDSENYIITETAVNSGVFRVSGIATAEQAQATPNNQVLETIQGDTLIANVNCAFVNGMSAYVLVDPYGVVFDSVSNQPISGAVVTLYRVEGNQIRPATVYENDGVTEAPNQVTTDENGIFRFPLVEEGVYRVGVEPPAGYHFPSEYNVADLPNDRIILTPGSWGGNFEVSESTGAVRVDIPLDPTGRILVTDIAVNPNDSYTGTFVNVSSSVRNLLQADGQDTVLSYSLPLGSNYVKGSLIINGHEWPEAAVSVNGQTIQVSIGELPQSAVLNIEFLLSVGPGAQSGQVTFVASADVAGDTISSNTSRDELRVISSEKHAHIIGRVYMDCNQNRKQDAEELGIPAVRLFLQDGRFVVTDSEGKYSFYGLPPRLHVLRLDVNTMPTGSELEVLGLANAGDPVSRFADLKRNELHKANFAEQSCAPKVMAQVIERRRQGRVTGAEIERVGYSRLKSVQRKLQQQNKLPERGLFDDSQLSKGELPETQGKQHPISQGAFALLNHARRSSLPVVNIADNKLAFVDLTDGEKITKRQMTVRVKGVIKAKLLLEVNGQAISPKKVGRRISYAKPRAVVWEYVGVDFEPGANALTLKIVDPFGNERGSTQITVHAPGELAELTWLDSGKLVADGQTPVSLTLQLLDKNGYTVNSRTPVTVETDSGEWLSKDLDPQRPGLQLIAEQGLLQMRLLPPMSAKEITVNALAGSISRQHQYSVGQEQRSMMLVGLLEAGIEINDQKVAANAAARFDDEVEALSTAFASNKGKAHVRGAVFAKGRVASDYDLTLRYDSEGVDQSLFQTQQPNEYYPLWGDASLRGYDARSTSRFYMRVDKDQSWLLYGDYNNRSNNKGVDLARSNRALTGIKHHYAGQNLTVETYAAQQKQKTKTDEIAARGLSGLYFLTVAPIVENSETVEIIVRDSQQPDVVIQRRQLQRFVDYQLEAQSGELLLAAPLASFDSGLNPQYLSVSYTTEETVDEYWLAGVEANLAATKNLTVGVNVNVDDTPEDKHTLSGVNLSWENRSQLLGNVELLSELAYSQREQAIAKQQGLAVRLKIEQQSERLSSRLYYARSDEDYFNSAASLRAGREEWNARLSWKLRPRTALTSTVRKSTDLTTDNSQRSVNIGLEHFFGKGISAELAWQTLSADGKAERDSLLLAAAWSPVSESWLKKLSFALEAEKALTEEGGGERLMAGVDYALNEYAKIYARHSFIDDLGCQGGLAAFGGSGAANCSLFGVESRYQNGARLFSEYRLRDAINGDEAEAVIGLRHSWKWQNGLSANGSFERIEPLSSNDGKSTAATISGLYSGSELWKASARLEYRHSENGESWLNTMAWAHKLNRDWTMLTRSYYSKQQRNNAENSDELRLQFGMSYRDTDDDKFALLARYEWRQKKAEEQTRQHLLQLSGHWTLDQNVYTSAYYGLRWTELKPFATALHVFVNRWQWELNDRWAVGSMVAAESNHDGSTLHGGLGLELGYLVTANLWLSAGYNVFGFDAENLDGAGQTQQGAYINMRFKFDEYTFLPERWLR